MHTQWLLQTSLNSSDAHAANEACNSLIDTSFKSFDSLIASTTYLK
jgi:hypothetical protein